MRVSHAPRTERYIKIVIRQAAGSVSNTVSSSSSMVRRNTCPMPGSTPQERSSAVTASLSSRISG